MLTAHWGPVRCPRSARGRPRDGLDCGYRQVIKRHQTLALFDCGASNRHCQVTGHILAVLYDKVALCVVDLVRNRFVEVSRLYTLVCRVDIDVAQDTVHAIAMPCFTLLCQDSTFVGATS